MWKIAVLAALCASASLGQRTILDDTFADGNSQNQDLANNSVFLFNGRTNNIRREQPGSVTLDMTPAGTGSEAVWAYFTPAGSPVTLGIGDKLTVAVTFSLTGFANNGQDIRWGVFDSLGTRNTTNLGGGQNDATFINDTGYGLQFYGSGPGTPFVLGRRTVLTNANVFNNFGDFATIAGEGPNARQALQDNTRYTLSYTIERVSATATRLNVVVTGGTLTDYTYTGTETSSAPLTSFDYFAFRVGGTNFARTMSFHEVKVVYSPAPPVITAQPQLSSLTVQVGSSVTLSCGAAGSEIAFQWLRDGRPIAGATSSTLTLDSVQLADTGSYTARISNAGGSVTSNAVTLKVSTSPVLPAPKVSRQPASTQITLGESGTLSVDATGAGLVYQWFKNGSVIPNANGPQLVLSNVQIADTGSYFVVISNESGSIASAAAGVLVVSALRATAISPWNGQPEACVDKPLSIEFDQPVTAGKSGRIRIANAAGEVVDTIDLAASPQSRILAGVPYNYFPLLIDGRTVTIYPHQQLAYGETYTVSLEPGVLTDAAGAPYSGLDDPAVWRFRTRATAPRTGLSAITVAGDGTGDFCTIQGAVDSLPATNTTPVTITLRRGTYPEIVYIPTGKAFITVRGEDRDQTVIAYPNNNNLNPATATRPTFAVDAPDFTLENLTIWNTTIKGGSQAEAFRSSNRRVLLNRVNLRSYQDTALIQGTGFVTDSYLEGDVDFMWGGGAVYWQNCELRGLSSGGYYTQIRNGQGQAGNVYVNSRLTAPDGVTGMYLARIDPGVFPYSQVVWINVAMGPHIIPAGWLLNNATTAPNVQFWEYRSTDLAGAALNVSARAPFSRQMTAQEAAQWSDPAFVLGGWVPYTVNTVSSAVAAGATLAVNWSAAQGHSAKDWVGLYDEGAPDTQPLAWFYIGAPNTGRTNFTAPARAGRFEVRAFLNDGFTRAAVSNVVTVTR